MGSILSVKKFTGNFIMKIKTISKPALLRLCTLYRVLGKLEHEGVQLVSSVELGKHLGVASHNVRKDVNCLGEIGNSGSGYNVFVLREYISNKINLAKKRNACVVGLGRIGCAIVEYDRFPISGYSIVAGFDSDINHLDTIKTSIPVYPSYMIEEVVKNEKIELAVIAVSATSADDVYEKLISGGVKGVINFSSVILTSNSKEIHIKNMDILGEFTMLSAQIAMDEKE